MHVFAHRADLFWDINVTEMDEDVWRVHILFDMTVIDASSISVLASELVALYVGVPLTSLRPSASFRSFAERSISEKSQREADAYWSPRLAGMLSLSCLSCLVLFGHCLKLSDACVGHYPEAVWTAVGHCLKRVGHSLTIRCLSSLYRLSWQASRALPCCRAQSFLPPVVSHSLSESAQASIIASQRAFAATLRSCLLGRPPS